VKEMFECRRGMKKIMRHMLSYAVLNNFWQTAYIYSTTLQHSVSLVILAF
jgi:hypothetical protein